MTDDAFGNSLKAWRKQRRLSQLDLAGDANISTRHLSFLETGRSKPSRDMILHLSECLDVPLRERNALLVSAGFAPIYAEHDFDGDAGMAIRTAVDQILSAHEPYPALAMDRHWNMVVSNRIVPMMLGGVDPEFLRPPVNLLRLSLHPDGLASRVVNFQQWRDHLLDRLRRQIELTADRELVVLYDEVTRYREPDHHQDATGDDAINSLIVPLVLKTDAGTLRFVSTTTVFGTPVEVTLSELAIETLLPADDGTRTILKQLAARM
ncbi:MULTISPECIES: helix-turn-helix domain-containing protein [Thalassospira]|uniref:XRE family transcriptional regulator n=2 Tax=Thalassospira TaxID=168934 RepID=A0A367WD14_9PROT|nr:MULTISPECIES: helix-turn-helix transcriptional regulator [Thalassospira]MDG4719983.1 helix-turn-helix transcriptional regulator [Thalassospira sp. FZY0004]RCK38422.1 XRE family transcriptional regulator [Thalassospira profundimaris]